MQPTTPDRLLSAREFRSLTGVGTTKFYDMLKRGEVKAVKLGARTVVPESEYRRFLSTLPALNHHA